MGETRDIVITFNDATLADLRDLERLEELNPTTIVNRAVQIYHALDEVRRGGGEILVRPMGETDYQHFRWE